MSFMDLFAQILVLLFAFFGIGIGELDLTGFFQKFVQ